MAHRKEISWKPAASSTGLGRRDTGFVRRGLQALAVTRAPSNPVHGHSEVSETRKVPALNWSSEPRRSSRWESSQSFRGISPSVGHSRLSNGCQHLPHSRLFLVPSVLPRATGFQDHYSRSGKPCPQPLFFLEASADASVSHVKSASGWGPSGFPEKMGYHGFTGAGVAGGSLRGSLSLRSLMDSSLFSPTKLVARR